MTTDERGVIEEHCYTPFDTEAKRYCRALLTELDRVRAECSRVAKWGVDRVDLGAVQEVERERDAALAQVERLREALEAVRAAGPSPEVRRLFEHYGYEPEPKR